MLKIHIDEVFLSPRLEKKERGWHCTLTGSQS